MFFHNYVISLMCFYCLKYTKLLVLFIRSTHHFGPVVDVYLMIVAHVFICPPRLYPVSWQKWTRYCSFREMDYFQLLSDRNIVGAPWRVCVCIRSLMHGSPWGGIAKSTLKLLT